jgi:acetolactate synthase-1/2/3 large subunit|tara:strand:+ start:3745 stop:5385 length:1641 start_codon:yes stop_codon:yes gene_type:complete
MQGNNVIAKILKAEGVDFISCFPANTLIDQAAKEGIKPMICRQERAGVNIADGFSRINNGRKIGVFVSQHGPGAENAFSGVAQAFSDSVPILILPGGPPSDKVGISPAFSASQQYTGITKWSGHVNKVSRIPELMRKAFSQLKNGKPGPVLLEIPTDVAQEEFPESDFSYTPIKPLLSSASKEDVRELVTAVLKAKNPIINAGQGILYSEATDELIEFSELTNIPVMTTLAGKSAFPENHKLSLGTGAHTATVMAAEFLNQSDFMLGIGTSFTSSNFNAPVPEGVTLGQVTNSHEDINKEYKIDFGAVGDAKLVLQQMNEEVKRQCGNSGRNDEAGVVTKIASIKKKWLEEWNSSLNSDEVPISPYRVFTELSNIVDVSNTIITHDSGYPRDQLVPFWETVAPRTYIGWGKSTQLGYGLGLAIGAKIARPNMNVINVMGDAAFGMAGLDIETAARLEIPILTIVLNNGVMTHYSEHMPFATDKWQTNALGGDYSGVAKALGAYSERVDQPENISSSIKNALKANSNGQPALLEFMTKEELNVPKFW